MTISRRGFLSVSLAAAALLPFSLPRRARAAMPLPRDADVVVIGAGMAGIAAAHRIAAAGRRVVVLEAAPQVGGRCITDTFSFDLPFDRGARWLYNPDANPLVKPARAAGFELVPAPIGQKIRIGRRFARAGETEEFLTTLVRANRAIDESVGARTDPSCAAVMPGDLGDWAGTVRFLLGPYAAGKDLADLSAVDQAHALDRTTALYPPRGLGTLTVRLAEGLPVAVSTPAQRIAWSNRDVSVDTPSGRITARVAIVTASTSMLASGAITFAPDLPKRQLDAASKLGLGSYDRIGLLMSGNPLGLSRDDALIERSEDTQTGLLLANIAGSTLCTVDVGGSFGRDLSAQGESAMAAFATEWLTKLFGSETAAKVKRTAATRWNSSPFVRGAMSAAAPGGAPSRKILTEPVGAMFFAGEATHETLWGTVDGAWESGERAAEAALRRIGAIREPAAAAAPKRKPPRHRRRAPAKRPREASGFFER